MLQNNHKIYIHCKGGHGRSGILVACILSKYYNITTEKSIELTTKFHNERKGMREKWKKIGSPQTYRQKNLFIKCLNHSYFLKLIKKELQLV